MALAMANAIAAPVLAALLRPGGGWGLHSGSGRDVSGAGFPLPGPTYELICLAVLAPLAADGFLDIAFADQRFSVFLFSLCLC